MGKFSSRTMPLVLWQTEPIQLEQPNIRPHPLFIADTRHRQFQKPPPGGAAHLNEPRRLITRGEKGVKRLLRKPCRSNRGRHDLLTFLLLPLLEDPPSRRQSRSEDAFDCIH